MTAVAIVNSGLANLDSIYRALEECGGRPFVTQDAEEVLKADKILLPGVGAFGAAMSNLSSAGLDEALVASADKGTTILGICLGMQLLADESDEMGLQKGLGLIAGRVERLAPSDQRERVPHMGWNTVHATAPSQLFDQVNQDADFYFVHSFHLKCRDDDVVATTPFCGGFVSVIERENVFGTQFHPEKSLRSGLSLLSNFLTL